MGEVYRARDTRLEREVAVKVLPAALANDPDRLRRLELEARTASVLNHPNVLSIYDVGMQDGCSYLVSELLDGAPLRTHISEARIPAQKAVEYGIAIAKGLAAAHDRGIIHRDVKPENVFITRDGRVKILDFGIATLVETIPSQADLTTWRRTEPGVMVGTAGYMSPEQVQGQPVDLRSDVFAFGVVLHEMLSGRHPFRRDTAIETLNAIIKEPAPSVSETSPEISPALERILRHCLEKDPLQRFQSAHDVAFALQGVDSLAAAGVRTGISSSRLTPRPKRVATLVVAAAGMAVAAALGAKWGGGPRVESTTVRFEVPPPASGSLQGILGISSAVSPDGKSLVMVVTTGTGTSLFIRDVASTEARQLEGTDGAGNPFWSPDSRWIGFFARGKVKRVPLAGGVPQTVCDVSSTSVWSVASWGAEDTIVMTGVGGDEAAAVLKVKSSGGTPSLVIPPSPPDTISFFWPSFLPDGRHFIVSAVRADGIREIRIGSVDQKDTVPVLRAYSRAIYAEPGYLLYVREGSLVAQQFDVETLRIVGGEQVVVDRVLYFRDLGQADFSVSRTGVLAYQGGATASRLVWYRRDGTEDQQLAYPDDYFFIRLSPDNRKLAVSVMERRSGTTDIRLIDLDRDGYASAITSDSTADWTPVFSPDGQQLAFASARRGPPHVFVKRITDPGAGRELVPAGKDVEFVTDWARTPRGEFIVYHGGFSAETGVDLMAVHPSGSPAPQPLVEARGDEGDGRVSPDGKWLAYASNESGRSEVYVRSLAGNTDRWPISSGGGLSPRWRRDGRELYYLAGVSVLPFGPSVIDGKLMAVGVDAENGALRAAAPKPLFSVTVRQGQYEPSSDGQRFLVNAGRGSAALPVTVWLEWTHALAR